MDLNIRKYDESDTAALARLFYETVHAVCAGDYTAAQLSCWADGRPDLGAWKESLSAHISYVAESCGKIVGFGDIDKSGYLDRLFVHKDFLRRGIAGRLCDVLETSVSVRRIYTHSSVTALPFFLSRGYIAVSEEYAERDGERLKYFVAEKITRF